MLKWIARRKYRHFVCDLATLIVTGYPADRDKALRSQFVQTFDASYADRFSRGDEEAVVAIAMARDFLAALIEQATTAPQRREIHEALSTWCEGSNPFQNLADPSSSETASVLHKLQTAIVTVATFAENGWITKQIWEIFLSELRGILREKSSEQRSRERVMNSLHDALELPTLREGDDGPLIEQDFDRGDPPLFSGIEVRVNLTRAPVGILLTRADDGTVITDRRALKQDDLERVPLDAEGYLFVNVEDKFGDNYSCVITLPTFEVFGSMAAFFWSLARQRVTLVYGRLRTTRMTQVAFAHVCASAQAVWNAAIGQAGSIDRMRGMIAPLRNKHLEAIENVKAHEATESRKLGVELAGALILATQTADLALEGYAYRCFRRYLWAPGEEPVEFRVHESH